MPLPGQSAISKPEQSAESVQKRDFSHEILQAEERSSPKYIRVLHLKKTLLVD